MAAFPMNRVIRVISAGTAELFGINDGIRMMIASQEGRDWSANAGHSGIGSDRYLHADNSCPLLGTPRNEKDFSDYAGWTKSRRVASSSPPQLLLCRVIRRSKKEAS